MCVKILIPIFLSFIFIADAAKILGIFHYPSKSHFILGSTLLKALARNGHQVTMLSPYLLKTPIVNYEEIELAGMEKFIEENLMKETLELTNASVIKQIYLMQNRFHAINELFFNNPSVKELLASNRTYDLVIQAWFGNSAYLSIPHHFKAATVAFSTLGSFVYTNSITRNPAPYSYVPNIIFSFPSEMNFIQRVGNTITGVAADISSTFLSRNEEWYRAKYFPNAPAVDEMVKNISLVLLNSHYSIESPRPYVPNTILIGGFHCEEPKELEGGLKSFMDSASEGVIFFSLGSNIKSADLFKNKLDAILGCFSKLSLKVVWKFESKNLPNLPPNVFIDKWLPQKDILAHPHTKVFISHGGLLSTTEAIYSGVPIIGIPIIGDQEINVKHSVKNGFALKVSLQELTEETLTEAIKEILSNPMYRDNIKKRSLILRDQPIKPIDKAVYWVEYVLRHNGAHHLKTSALKLEWYQYLLLDVIAFILIILIAITIIIYYALRWILRTIKKYVRGASGEMSKSKLS